MEIYLNLWGGEGYLSSAALLAMASMGMLEDMKDKMTGEENQITFDCFDFAHANNKDLHRTNVMYDAYQKYYVGILGGKNNVVKGGKTIDGLVVTSTPRTLAGKFNQKELLAFGCTEADMDTDISNGIYGKPWIGEAYYSDSKFDRIYQSASGQIVVINCGGYKGGGTAATFIPLENRFNPQERNQNIASVEKFNVIAGPSTTFNCMLTLPNPGIYADQMLADGVNIFDIGCIDAMAGRYTVRGRELTASEANKALHESNVQVIAEMWARVQPFKSLDPRNYMPRFLDRMSSDSTLTKIKASFVNLKPNLTRQGDSYNYDVTSPEFQPDQQDHKLHITNLLNALDIQEIAVNHGDHKYSNGAIIAFQNAAANIFNVSSLFRENDVKYFYRFLAFSILIINYAYNCFDDITRAGTASMLDRWALTEKSGFLGSGVAVAARESTEKGKLNLAFAKTAKQYMVRTAHEYIKPVLQAMMDIHDTSNETVLFPTENINGSQFSKGLCGIVQEMLNKIHVDSNGQKCITPIDNATAIQDNTEKTLAAVMMIPTNKNFNDALTYLQGLPGVGNFLQEYQQKFPAFGSRSGRHWKWDEGIDMEHVAQKAEEHCDEILKYTYEKVSHLL